MARTARKKSTQAGRHGANTRSTSNRSSKRSSARGSGRRGSWLSSERLATLAESRGSSWTLAAVSFTESFAFFVPPDALLIPLALASPARAWRFALICTLASVAGALMGYGIGALAYHSVGEPLLELFGHSERFNSFSSDYNAYGSWAVLVAGITPFPFKVVTILSGSTGLSLPVFVASCAIARGTRFFLIAALLRKFGPLARRFLEPRMGMAAAVIVLGALAVVVLLALVQIDFSSFAGD